MTLRALEKKLKPLEEPLQITGLKWLYLHFPPQPLRTAKMHRSYSHAASLLLQELERSFLGAESRTVITRFLEAILPFIEAYEKKHSPIPAASPEDMLRFLMEQQDLSQYDLANDLGGQPVVSDVLRGKRKLTREHIERLSRRFHTPPAAFYPTV